MKKENMQLILIFAVIIGVGFYFGNIGAVFYGLLKTMFIIFILSVVWLLSFSFKKAKK